jgi:hypothetical protein
MSRIRRRRPGLTLSEPLVIVGIVAALAGLVLSVVLNVQSASRRPCCSHGVSPAESPPAAATAPCETNCDPSPDLSPPAAPPVVGRPTPDPDPARPDPPGAAPLPQSREAAAAGSGAP